MNQRWVARWTAPDGTPQQLYFSSTSDLKIARIDFRLKLMDLGLPYPHAYDLEEAQGKLSSIPRRVRLGGIYEAV
jgi:hypothetical protein